jgi:hypothetical protein
MVLALDPVGSFRIQYTAYSFVPVVGIANSVRVWESQLWQMLKTFIFVPDGNALNSCLRGAWFEPPPIRPSRQIPVQTLHQTMTTSTQILSNSSDLDHSTNRRQSVWLMTMWLNSPSSLYLYLCSRAEKCNFYFVSVFHWPTVCAYPVTQ